MADEGKNLRLGLLVSISTLLLIAGLYLIGNKQNLFGSTFRICAEFNNVGGLMKGNNVRFAGIDVGTVESVEIVSDSSVRVQMIIEKRVQKFIKRNALASVGTDGLMGNKLVNINANGDHSKQVEEGDTLQSMRPVEMDQMVRTLDVTNQNIKVITGNLKNITEKINSKNSLWSLLMDTLVAENLKSTIVNLKLFSNRSLLITGNLKGITESLANGKGTVGALITDTTLSAKIRQVVVKLDRLNDTAAVLTGDVSHLVKRVKEGKGSLGILLNDTNLVSNLNKSMENIKAGSGNFNQNMEALKYSWPFKKYYKKQGKK